MVELPGLVLDPEKVKGLGTLLISLDCLRETLGHTTIHSTLFYAHCAPGHPDFENLKLLRLLIGNEYHKGGSRNGCACSHDT